MKSMTALALLLTSASTAFAASAPTNESFISQVGDDNSGLVSQADGNNTQGTVQVGTSNGAITSQAAATFGANNSGTFQSGVSNASVVGQTGGGNTRAPFNSASATPP